MLKIDRSQLDKSIKAMNLFTATQEALNAYEKEKAVLDKRGNDLSERIAELTERHATTLVDRESANGNTSDYIYLSKELASIDENMKIILSLQEQLAGDFTLLKQKYAPIIQATYSKELSAKNELNVNDMVDYVRYELLKAITDYAGEVKKQQAPLLPAIGEFLDDKEVMEANRGFSRLFEFDKTNLIYGESQKSVIDRMHVFSAVSGNMPSNIYKPKN